jgi:hypothetical protein
MSTEGCKKCPENKIRLVVHEKGNYSKLKALVDSANKANRRVCYVCLSKPYGEVIKELNGISVDPGKFIFIDILTYRYVRHRNESNCIFVPWPDNMNALDRAIKKAIRDKKCDMIILDTIFSLLEYHPSFHILKFTNNMISSEGYGGGKVFVILKGGGMPTGKGIESLEKDIAMFAGQKP